MRWYRRYQSKRQIGTFTFASFEKYFSTALVYMVRNIRKNRKLQYLLRRNFYFITLFKIGWLVPFAIMDWFWWPQNYSKHRWITLELVLRIVDHWKPLIIWICFGQHLRNFQVWSYRLFAYKTNSVFH